MYIHAFGAYFGLAVAYIFSTSESRVRTNNHSVYTSDTFSMLGTIFLWMFWPSFNGALAVDGGQQQRVVINTVLSLCVSCTVTFCYSTIIHDGKFEIVEIQNATLAGGVAVGCSANLLIGPWGAMLIGFVAGTISTFGFAFLTPFLEETIGLHDTAGIHNLHGMPGVLGGLVCLFASLAAQESNYGDSLGLVFPDRAPSNATLATELGLNYTGKDRDAGTQAGFQAAATFTSVAIGITTGLMTGYFIQFFDKFFTKTDPTMYFLDTPYWHLPKDYPGNIIPNPKNDQSVVTEINVAKEESEESSDKEAKMSNVKH